MPEPDLSAFREVPAGRHLFREGDPADGAYLIAGGSVEVRRKSADGGPEVAVLAPGDIVGEMALFVGGTRSADAAVVEDARMIFISSEEFRNRVAGMDPVMRRISKILVRRILAANELAAAREGRSSNHKA